MATIRRLSDGTIVCGKCSARVQHSPAGITIICIPCWRSPDNCTC